MEKQTNGECTPNTKQIFSSRYCWNVSISSLLIGLCDNTSCEFSSRVEIFQLARKTCLQAYIVCSRQLRRPERIHVFAFILYVIY